MPRMMDARELSEIAFEDSVYSLYYGEYADSLTPHDVLQTLESENAGSIYDEIFHEIKLFAIMGKTDASRARIRDRGLYLGATINRDEIETNTFELWSTFCDLPVETQAAFARNLRDWIEEAGERPLLHQYLQQQ